MNCPECTNEMEYEEATQCNYNSPNATKGEHTGDIYSCKGCESTYLDNFLSGKVEPFNYDL